MEPFKDSYGILKLIAGPDPVNKNEEFEEIELFPVKDKTTIKQQVIVTEPFGLISLWLAGFSISSYILLGGLLVIYCIKTT